MRELIAFLLLFVWLCIGAWFYTCKVKNLCWETPTETTVLTEPTDTIIHPARLKSAFTAVFDAEKNIFIQKSSYDLVQSDISYTGLDTIAQFLKRYSDTEVTITGAYASDETNPTTFENIGLARANRIENILIEKGVNPNQINTASSQEDGLFVDTEQSKQEAWIDFQFSERYDDLNHADVKAAYKALLTMGQDMAFKKDSESVDIYEQAIPQIEAIRYYLNGNKAQSLQIVMPYIEEEPINNDTDIGLVRAANLKEQLAVLGIFPDRIETQSVNTIDIFDEDGLSLPTTIDFNFVFPDLSDATKVAEMELERNLEKALNQPTESEESEISASEETPIAETEVTDSTGEEAEPSNETESYSASSDQPNINFDYMSVKVKVNDEITQYMSELKDLLNNSPDSEVLIKGHADSFGTDDFNYKMGYQRARQTKLVMLRNGIPAQQIRIMSEGERFPIASNETNEGRRQNRRVEIDIQ